MGSIPPRLIAIPFSWLAVAIATPSEPADVGPLLKAVVEKHNAPGALAAVVKDGRIEAIGAAGVRKLGGEPAAVGDLSLIGSCGKSVTRLLLARLVDQGKLRFEDMLEKLLPDVKMRDEYRGVTLAQIMAHRGGLQPYSEVGPRRTPFLFSLSGAAREQRAAFVAHLLMEEPSAKPGTREVYSNAGFCLLGHIAERLTNIPFESLVEREVFAPLEMKDSFVGRPTARPGRPQLTGHRRASEGYVASTEGIELAVMAPAGMMTCTIGDFARLAGTLAQIEGGAASKFLKPETAKQIGEATPGGFEEGVPYYGGDGNYTAAFALWPRQKLAIVVESNAGDNDAVCAAAIEALRAKFAPEVRAVPQEEGPGGRPSGPRLGISIRASNPDDVKIDSVEPGSIAEKAGLKAGDRILAINGTPMSEIPQEKLRPSLAGKQVKFKVEREGKTLDLVIERPTE